MKINPTSQYLSLISRSLNKDVVPYTHGDRAKQAIDTIQIALKELLKRQQSSAILLQECIVQGEKILAELQEKCSSSRSDDMNTKMPVDDEKKTLVFDALISKHDYLTVKINEICVALSQSSEYIPQTTDLLLRAAEWEYKYYAELQKLDALPFGDDASGSGSPEHLVHSVSPLSKDGLQEYLQKNGMEAVDVLELASIPGGFGKQTFTCVIKDKHSGKTQDLIVRKMDPAPIMEHSSFNLELEYDLLCCLSGKTNFPVPRPVKMAPDPPGIDGSFYLVEKVAGKVLGNFFGDSEGVDLHAQENVILRLADHLADLHQYPLDIFTEYFEKHETADSLDENVTQRYRRNLQSWKEYVGRVKHLESPFFTWLFHWLENNIPEDDRQPCLTHGDYYIHNVLVDGGEITAILDWECSDFGAPEQDLAYMKPLVSKHMDWQRFLDRYKESGGKEVNEKSMSFCRAYGFMRIFLGASRATVNLQEGTNRDIRYVMVELGFTPSIMQMALEKVPKEQQCMGLGNTQSHGHSSVISKPSANQVSDSDPEANEAVITTDDNIQLPICSSAVNIRQQPSSEQTWQNSVVLTWWDDKNALGGFHRIGHEPNLPGGSRVALWNFLTGPEGSYHTSTYNSLRPVDSLDDGSFGSGDDTCRMIYQNNEHVWRIHDQDIEAELHCSDLGPNIDCYPKRGSLNKGFTSAHFDIPVSVDGSVTLKGKAHRVHGLGVRDNGWGARDWNSVFSHRWVAGTAGKHFFFCAVTWHSVDEGMASFAWVVRSGKVTYAEEVDVVAKIELDAATNRGGEVRLTLTTGENLHIICTPCTAKASASFHPAGVCVVDRLCTFQCGDITGMCDFETTSNIQKGTRRPGKFSNSIIENGFFA